jgi:hypothetical protein
MTGKRKRADDSTFPNKVKTRGKCSYKLTDGATCPNKELSKGLCAKHAYPMGICSYKFTSGTPCINKAKARGLCHKHAYPTGTCSYKLAPGITCTNKEDRKGLCSKHAGYKRRLCEKEGCTSSTQGSGFCKKHGGGYRCQWPDKRCTKHAQGGTKFCASHGGCKKCEADCCKNLQDPSVAAHKHPVSGCRICTFAARVLVAQALYTDGDVAKYKEWMKHFGFKKDLVLRAEHAFYFMLVKEVPKLAQMVRALDQSIASALEGKAKRSVDPRPDYLHYSPAANMALYGEFDEHDNHEDDDNRLRRIADQVGCGIERTYVFRVKAHLEDPSRALFVRKIHNKHHTYYSATDRGKQVVQEVAQHVRECLALMTLEIPPVEQNSKVVFG